jgi:RHS repeat-associated protein
MELTYYTSGGSGDGGDQYTGLDRFGRVVDQRWDISGTDVERLKYGYDRASNRVWRQNTVAGSGQDEYYTQDGLYQLATLQRGTLNTGHTGITGTPGWEEDFNYDPLGNWHGSSSGYVTKVAGTTTLSQNRSHSKVNAISGLTTATGTAWASPAQDAAGNLTTVPRPLSPANGYTLKYDAWNRLVSVKAGSTVVATYAYDGANRRVTKTTTNTRHYYYDDRWRVVEERLDSATSADRRFVWGIRRLDDLILRDREYGGGGDESSSSSAGGEGLNRHRLYAVDDLANVTALVDRAGAVLERYGYNGFGGVRYLTAGFGSRSTSLYDWETLFGSYRYDTDTGLYLARFRYFHPLLGRWINRDIIEEFGGTNLYAYCRNNTINYVDLLGLINWGLLGTSIIGLVADTAVAVAGTVLAETGVGAVAAVYAAYGAGANAGNIWNALTNDNKQGPTGPVQAVANLAFPNNTTANYVGQSADFGVGLLLTGGLGSSAEIADAAGLVTAARYDNADEALWDAFSAMYEAADYADFLDSLNDLFGDPIGNAAEELGNWSVELCP